MPKTIKNQKIPEILNSKTESIIIELPEYAYSHSSEAENRVKPFFIGRKGLVKRLKHIIRSSSSKTGVYLVAGDRGVGKTSLVDEVIKKTSLQKRKPFYTFLIVLLFLILSLQYISNQFFLKIEGDKNANIWLGIVSTIALQYLFYDIGEYSFIRRKKVFKEKKYISYLWDCFWSTIRDISKLPNNSNPMVRMQNIKKLLFIVTLCFVVQYWTFYLDYYSMSIFETFVLFTFYLFFCAIVRYIRAIKNESLKNRNKDKYKKFRLSELISIINRPFRDYINNHSRVYIKINFGNDILKERDILRLITKTLSIEYERFCRSFRRSFYWRLLKLLIIIMLTFLFYKHVYLHSLKGKMNNSWFQNANTEHTGTNNEENATNGADTNEIDIVVKLIIDSPKYFLTHWKNIKKDKDYTKCDDIQKGFTKYFIYSPKSFHSKTSKVIYDSVLHKDRFAVLLIVLILYLLGKTILRLNLNLKIFTTHNEVRRKLNQLNESIYYAIESETDKIISAEHPKGIGLKAGFRRTKTRPIADVKEIEKELQYIFEEIQNIPMFMNRPEFVIVFDELDKVNPTMYSKEDMSIRDHLFAYNSTRDRQAIILKLLSNMKYLKGVLE